MIPPCKDENTTFGRYKFFTNCYHLLTFAIPNLDVRVLTGDHYHHSSGSAEKDFHTIMDLQQRISIHWVNANDNF